MYTRIIFENELTNENFAVMFDFIDSESITKLEEIHAFLIAAGKTPFKGRFNIGYNNNDWYTIEEI